MSKQNDMDTLAALQRIKAKTTTLSKEIKSKPVTSMVTTGTPQTVDQTFNQMHNDLKLSKQNLPAKVLKKADVK